MCIEWRPYNYVLSTIDTEVNWRSTNKEAIQFAKVVMWKESSVHEREKNQRNELSSEHPEMIAIRTPLLAVICMNNGLNILKNKHEQQRGNCTNIFNTSAGRTKKTRIPSLKKKYCSGVISQTRNVKSRLKRIHAYCEQQRLLKSKTQVGKRKNVGRFSGRMEQLLRQKKVLSMFEIWTC